MKSITIIAVFFINLGFSILALAKQQKALEYFDLADAFNRECSGAVSAYAEIRCDEAQLPDPLEIEPQLKISVLTTLGLSGGAIEPVYSNLQSDLSLLNVVGSSACSQMQWQLEQAFHVYGLKAWIQRAGASSYFLIRRQASEPRLIEIRSYYTW